MATKVTLDARTGLYRRDLGWKKAGEDRYIQHRFYLGRDKHKAQIACARLEALWADIEARWESLRDRLRATWDETTLAIAKGIIEGETETVVRPPKIVKAREEWHDTELLGIWFADSSTIFQEPI